MKNLYHLLVTSYKLLVTSYKLRVTSYELQVTNLFCRISDIGYRISFIAFLFLPFFAFAQATVTGVLYSCPEQVTVTYTLNSKCPVNLTLQYSHDCETWTAAQEINRDLTNQTGDGTLEETIIWNNAEEGENGVIFGKFYFKVTYPGSDDSQEPVEHDYVEIDGVKWATCNVATPRDFADSPTDTGWYYQWGINVGWRPSPNTPLLNSNGGTTWSSTNPPLGSPPYTSVNPPEWLCAPCPAGWRLPTRQNFIDLEPYVVNELGPTLDLLNGIPGRFFDSDDPLCQPLLFLPAAGYRNTTTGSLTNVRTNGTYWSSTPLSNTTAYGLGFNSIDVGQSTTGTKTFGYSIRCVAEN